MYTQIASNKRKTWLLIGAFIIFITLIGFVFSQATNNHSLLYFAVGFSIIYVIISYFYSDKMVLAVSRAHEIQKKDNPQLYRLVENLSITAGLPTPKIYIISDNAPNAFATGRDPKHSMVVVTSGILEMLDKKELEGVLAHELSHIGNYDIKLMTIVVLLVSVIALISDWFIRIAIWGGDDEGGGQMQLIFLVIGIIFAILAPIIAILIQLAVSRKREYLADASGALLTRYPEGLEDALQKISDDTKPLKEANKATAHMYIVNPFRSNVKRGANGLFAGLFSTHPPIEERIKRLKEMESKV
ncbi:MAG: zinc metalloprotease HtpX [bacterium]|nr:zinc metalloprotease HtpX [bacterium]